LQAFYHLPNYIMADATTPPAQTPNAEMQDLHDRHDKWVREVRDLAKANSEGVREITVAGASAEYEIAPLPDGRFAIHWSFQYSCGNCSGSSIPWVAIGTRDLCIEAFTKAARKHFARKLLDFSATGNQQQAQKAMLQQLEVGLFGFVEPEVSTEATKRNAEIADFVQSHGF